MSQQTVYTFAKWQVKEGQLQQVLQTMKEVARRSREEDGNLLYKVFQSNAEPNTIFLFEAYADAVAVETHRNSAYFQELVIGKIVPLLEKREVTLASEIDFAG